MGVNTVEGGGYYADFNPRTAETNPITGQPKTQTTGNPNVGNPGNGVNPGLAADGRNRQYTITSPAYGLSGEEGAKLLLGLKTDYLDSTAAERAERQQTEEFVRAIEAHKDDPKWLKGFFEALGPQKTAEFAARSGKLGPAAQQTVANGLKTAMTIPQKYHIKPGDYLYKIIRNYNREHPNAQITLEDVLKLNPQIKDPNLINAHDDLILPSIDDTGGWTKNGFNSQFAYFATQDPSTAASVAPVIALLPPGHPLKAAFVDKTIQLGLNNGDPLHPTQFGGDQSSEAVATKTAQYANLALTLIDNDPVLKQQYEARNDGLLNNLRENATYKPPVSQSNTKSTKGPDFGNPKRSSSGPHGKGF